MIIGINATRLYYNPQKFGLLILAIGAYFLIYKRGELSLWKPPSVDEKVYLLTVNQPVGYARVQSADHSIKMQLSMSFKRSSGAWVEQQLELYVYTLEGELRSSSSPYQLKWRQLTTEREGLWSLDQQLSTGGYRVHRAKTSTVSGGSQDRWCIDEGKVSSDFPTSKSISARIEELMISGLIVESSVERGQCFVGTRPLPDLLWPWLNPSENLKLFGALTGSLDDTSWRREAGDEQRWVRLAHFSTPLKSEMSLKFTDEQLTEWRQVSRGALWILSYGQWGSHLTDQGASTQERSLELSSFQSLEIQGNAPWKTARWISLIIESALQPLETSRQEVSRLQAGFTGIERHQLLLRRGPPALEFAQHRYRGAHVKLQGDNPFQRVVPELLDRLKSSRSEINEGQVIEIATRWINSSIRYQERGGYPDPVFALQRGTGDCNERSAALVSLLQALGFTAEQVFGLVYDQGGNWAFHAWVMVHTQAGPLEVDPNYPEEGVGADHIGLILGDIRDQRRLGVLTSQPARGEVTSWSR